MNVLMPTSLAEACTLCAKHPGVIPMAGATDLLVHWPLRQAEHDKSYLDLSKLSELRCVRWTADSLTLGALATYWDVLQDARIASAFPLLPDAARQVGAIQIQSRGTWAGNIANGSPAADGVPVLMAYDASVTLASAHGTRTVPLRSYYTGYRASVRKPDELIVSIEIPLVACDFAVFHKVGARKAQAITKVGLAITRLASGSQRWRVVASSVAATIKRCPTVEALLNTGTPLKAPADLAAAFAADVAPIDDIRSTADYRRTVLARLLFHSLQGVYDGAAAP
ncbi:MAG: FAD binding domain-containing protein [Phycisphaerales bacterium]